MPANVVKTPRDKRLWADAKAQVRKEYPDVDEGSDRFYKLTMGIFQRMQTRAGGGEVKKAVESRPLMVADPALRKALEQLPREGEGKEEET